MTASLQTTSTKLQEKPDQLQSNYATVPSSKRTESRLDSLTALRFIAAAMIVVSHSAGKFNCDPHNTIENLPLAQGVSFFFVLSGFILTYVYKDLAGLKQTLHFLAARIARVWPVFFVSGVVTYFLSPVSLLPKTPIDTFTIFTSQFFMLHGWVPQRLFYFSLDTPSWSISTEFFFYLAFPLLILNLRKTWLTKLLLVAALPITLICLCQFYNLPFIGEERQASSHALLYINPLSRIFEFYLGMLTCLGLTKLRTYQFNPLLVTVAELGSIAVIAGMLCNIEPWLFKSGITTAIPALSIYLKYCGNALGYVAVILAVGLERGYLSKVLRLPVLVLLGEVSYSVYLLHYPVLLWYLNNRLIFLHEPRVLRYAGFWVVLIALSTMAFFLLEKPARTRLRKLFDVLIEGRKPKQPAYQRAEN
jgi:peptidoglycan/LPS O-acetylase OafA/YrhL